MLMRTVESIDQSELSRDAKTKGTMRIDFTAIRNKMDNDYTNNLSLWSIYWSQGNIDIRLEAGDSSLMSQLNQNLTMTGSNSYYFNLVRPVCNMVSGYQRKNRKSTICVPLENADQQTADQFSKLLLQIYKKENVYETISEAFHGGACVTGMNLLQVYLDFTDDPVNGDVKIDNLSYNEFMIDPYFRKHDLSDAAFIWRRSYMTHSAAAAIMPEEYYDRIMSLQGNPSGMAKDGRFQYMPECFGYTQGNKVSYDEYWYRDYRKQKLLIDKETGETLDISRNEKADIDRFLSENPTVILIEKDVPTVRLAIRVQDEVMIDTENPLGIDDYPFIPVLGYYNKSMPYMYQRLSGICRSLRDPQILFNRRVILSSDLIESTVNSGWVFKENALVDVKHLFQTGQGRIIPIKDEAQMTDIQPIVPPQIPPSFFQLQETFDKLIYDTAGISQENLGKIVDDDASGYLSALRQGAGLISLQPIFDQLDRSCCMLGERIMKIMQMNYTPGKIERMLEGEKAAPLFYNKAFGKYHCQVQNGFNTESQQQMEFAQLLKLKETGVQISDRALIECATIQHKDKILAEMQQAQQAQQQMQQQQMQSQMQLQQAQSQLAQARAAADMGLYHERTSRVEDNISLAEERRSKAVQEETAATLNLIKSLRELEGLDLSHIRELLEMQQIIKGQEAVNKANEKPAQNSSAPVDSGKTL